MPDNGTITLEIKNSIGTIEFYHPKGNSMPGNLLRKLAQKITEVGDNPNAHVIVLKSKGEEAFCAGASFDELLAIDDFEHGKRFFMGFSNVINAMRTSSKLIIVRVQGKTVGGGVGIAAAGDYTFAHESASIKLSELSLGIGPFVIGPAVQHRLLSSAFSTLSVDSTSWYSSEWAREKGLFARVLETHGELDRSVDELSHELANSSPEAMKALKTVLWEDTGHWDALLEERAELSAELVLSDYTKNFIADFRKN